jgi:uncharacterized protein (DUF1800 family)
VTPRFRSALLWTAASLTLAWCGPAAAQDLEEVKVILVDGEMSESWPDPGVIAFCRAGTTGDLTVTFALSGTAKRDTDYTLAPGTQFTIPDGRREAWLSFAPIRDSLHETTETIMLNLLPGPGYRISKSRPLQSATLLLANETNRPGVKEAVRFLWQAGFGPEGDGQDVGMLPDGAELVMRLGFEPWIDRQFRLAPRLHQPVLDSLNRIRLTVNADTKMRPWWMHTVGPNATDPLRQRVAFALSQIFVISDAHDILYREPIGMTNYYDMLVKGAFGNMRDLLLNVTMHPCMGTYLSHLKNRRMDAESGSFPDENYAREIMQLFSIGLWMLNEDGTLKLDSQGRPIPTYDNQTISNMARVFTGLSFGGPQSHKGFLWPTENWVHPMRMWDEYHDLEPKTLLNGVVLPARTASSPDTGAAGMADVRAAVDCLFNHPNTAPFLSRQLIQRLVTSNPSPQYVGRVAAKFINNGSGVRGDMKAIIKAILLDPEARSPSMLGSETFGKLREPYLRTIALAKAFNARSNSGIYDVGNLSDVLYQQPLASPSVFNFFRPNFSPAGPINDAGLVAPEFQVVNALTSFATPNYFNHAIRHGFDRFGQPRDADVTRPRLRQEVQLATDVPALMRRLDLVLMGGTLHPAQHQIIREAVESIHSGHPDWRNERIYMAVYLMATLPECAVQR